MRIGTLTDSELAIFVRDVLNRLDGKREIETLLNLRNFLVSPKTTDFANEVD